jgi:hypothetical protein
MGTFTTTLCIPTACLPPDFVRLVNSRYPDCEPLGPTDTVDDVAVEVDFKEGWYDPGRCYGPPENCYPPEGEDPEILSVRLSEEGYPTTEIIKALDQANLDRLVNEANEVQRDAERYGYDDEPMDYDDGPY